MHVAFTPAPALRWSLALVLFAALGTSAQAQNRQSLAGAPAEILTPDTHVTRADGTTQPAVRCAVPDATEEELSSLTAAAEAFIAGGSFQARGGTVTIPVAVHVVNSGTAISQGNIPDQWITDQIEVLNEAFDGTTGGFNTTFRFVLDRTTRTTNASWFTGCYSNPTPMKQALAFSPQTHLNFYTCAPSGGILGFAVFPWSYPENSYNHGVVVHYNTLPGGTFFPYHLGDTGTHEVGHYLGLWHTFQGGCAGGDTPPGCQTSGDQVCDTAAESSPAFGCPFGRNTCGTGGPDPIDNFMDYTDDSCMNKYTAGQSTRMDQMVAQYRPTIWNATTGCSLAYVSSDLSYNAGTRRLTVNVTVSNSGGSAGTAHLYLDYNRNGGNPQGTRDLGTFSVPAGGQASRTFNIQVPAAAPDGNYNFTLRLNDGAGSDCDEYTETLSITAPRVGEPAAEASAADGSLFEASATTAPATTVAVAPNPFEGQTTIRFEVAEATDVRLAVYDVLGREVAVLVDGAVEAGAHTAVFDASALAAGTYVYRLAAGSDVKTGRMMVAR